MLKYVEQINTTYPSSGLARCLFSPGITPTYRVMCENEDAWHLHNRRQPDWRSHVVTKNLSAMARALARVKP